MPKIRSKEVHPAGYEAPSRKPKRLGRVRHAASTALMFKSFAIGGLILSWIVLPLTARRARRSEANGYLACQEKLRGAYSLFWRGMKLLRLFEVEVRGDPHAYSGPCVIVANHPTLVDVTAIGSVLPRMCCVAKDALFRNVFVGSLFRHVGYIRNRGAGSAADVIEAAVGRLAAGIPVLIFPEGTRSEPGSVSRFQRGAFEIARRADVPIVPVVVTCKPATLTKGMSWYSLPRTTARLVLHWHPPESLERWGGRTRAARDDFEGRFEAAVHRAHTESSPHLPVTKDVLI